MSFQIKNKGVALSMHQLDAEAAKFWGKNNKEGQYATPYEEESHLNWYDMIGWAIARQGHTTRGWKNIISTLYIIHIDTIMLASKGEKLLAEEEEMVKDLKRIKVFLQPFIDLIQYWHDKGYEPVQIK
jgi:hypothetical protein